MNIAFLLSPSNLASNVYSGVVAQAQSWATGLETLGHRVVFPSATERIDWAGFDLVHLFQHGAWCHGLLETFHSKGVSLVYSPIIDPPIPYGIMHKFASYIPFERFKLLQNQRLLRTYARNLDVVLARSLHEAQSLKQVGVPESKVAIVHIPFSKQWNISEQEVEGSVRNGAIFHISHLSQPRKNVKTLIDLAISRGFMLRLAGSISDPAFKNWLDNIQARHTNVRYLGRLSDDEMRAEMLACSVFCLPSLFEGVGLVALDAALCGAHLVVTNRGGTPEYLEPIAECVDPLDLQVFGAAIRRALSKDTVNSEGHRLVKRNFSPTASAQSLFQTYVRFGVNV